MPEETARSSFISRIFFEFKEIIMLFCGVLIIALIFGGLIYLFKDAPHAIVLPMISILGIISLLLCLSGISYVFVKVKLDNKEQALGLPPGSIQSVIALSLVVLFAILSVFVLATIGASDLRNISGLNASERDSQIDKLGSSFAGWQEGPKGSYTIFVRDPVAAGREDVGKQLIVLIGTLMTSAVSFYFGTRATASAVDKANARNDSANLASGTAISDREQNTAAKLGKPEDNSKIAENNIPPQQKNNS